MAAPPPGRWPAGRRRRETDRAPREGGARRGTRRGRPTLLLFYNSEVSSQQPSVVVAQYLHERGTLWKRDRYGRRTHASGDAADAELGTDGRPIGIASYRNETRA